VCNSKSRPVGGEIIADGSVPTGFPGAKIPPLLIVTAPPMTPPPLKVLPLATSTAPAAGGIVHEQRAFVDRGAAAVSVVASQCHRATVGQSHRTGFR